MLDATHGDPISVACNAHTDFVVPAGKLVISGVTDGTVYVCVRFQVCVMTNLPGAALNGRVRVRLHTTTATVTDSSTGWITEYECKDSGTPYVVGATGFPERNCSANGTACPPNGYGISNSACRNSLSQTTLLFGANEEDFPNCCFYQFIGLICVNSGHCGANRAK